MNTTLKQFGFPPHPVDSYKYLVGDGIVNLVVRALPANHRTEATINRVIAAERQEYDRNWASKTCPYEGIPELLDALTERKIPICILSNKPDEFTQVIVKRFLAKWKLSAVRGANDETPIKPDPSGAIRIAAALNLSPSVFLYCGDSCTDMETAKAAGMLPVGVLWGFRLKDELIRAGAKMLIEHPRDLLNLV